MLYVDLCSEIATHQSLSIARHLGIIKMENALYYTFSTIPQVLAAAIALLVAFVLYRLQTINKEIEVRSLDLQSVCIDQLNNDLWELHVNESYEKVFENSIKFQPTDQNNLRLFGLHRTRLGRLLEFKKSLLSSFNFSLIITVSLIIASVVVLPFTPTLKTYSCGSSIIFFFGILWFIVCLVCYANLAKKTIGYYLGR